MNTPEVEIFLAKLYTDEALLKRFAENPAAELAVYRSRGVILSEEAADSLLQLNVQDVMLAAQSYTHKRQQYQKRRTSWIRKLLSRP